MVKELALLLVNWLTIHARAGTSTKVHMLLIEDRGKRAHTYSMNVLAQQPQAHTHTEARQSAPHLPFHCLSLCNWVYCVEKKNIPQHLDAGSRPHGRPGNAPRSTCPMHRALGRSSAAQCRAGRRTVKQRDVAKEAASFMF